MQKLRSDVAAAEIVRALSHAGIRSIVLKGPSVARWLYSEDESRPYGDVDLLVSPPDFERAESAAAELGFRHLDLESQRLDEETTHETWYRERSAGYLELHRGFLGIYVSDQELWDVLSDYTEPFSLGIEGVVAEVLTVPARTVILALHAAGHGSAHARSTEDLNRGLDQVPLEVWEEAADIARRLRAEGAFVAGLSLLPRGREFVDRLGLTTDAPADVLLRAGVAPPTSIGWAKLASRHGVKAKLRYALSELAPSPEYLRMADPRAYRSRLWLAIAYVWRPFRLARQAPAGFRAWRAARRLSTASDYREIR